MVNKRKTNIALEQIKEGLFETVGPVADMVYDECLEKWTADKPADIDRLSELMAHISEEIDDQALFDEFKEKITTLF